jgi:hypothetical protein
VTSNDKTGDRLLASIRRTKTGATKKTGVSRKAPVIKKAAAGAAGTAPRRVVAADTPSPQPAADPVDPYQARRRVWPD